MKTYSLFRISYISLITSFLFLSSACKKEFSQPNFLICMADDWGWPHAGSYGDPVVQTPTFDQLASEGILFEHAYVSSPSCTPSRNAVLTGQYHWRLGQGANLHSTLDVSIPVYPLLLEEAGYFVGRWRKCWGPGKLEPGGYIDTNPGGPKFDGFKDFMDKRPDDQPFCFWLGSSDPHRGYKLNSGEESGMDLDAVMVPDFYPNEEIIRSDIADYYFEVQRFDRDCGEAIKLLRERGEIENTVIVMTGDHGMPFPRCKSNLYDMGVRVPLAIRWGEIKNPGREVRDFISFTDFAPTFLELAGVPLPEVLSGTSLSPILKSKKDGWVTDSRESVIFGKERHTPAQRAPSIAGYPCRSIRTEKWQYIYNFFPERWPAGVPEGASHPMNNFPDCDGGPTKFYLMSLKDDPEYCKYYNWSFAQRPQEELYDMLNDPFQLVNLAGSPDYDAVRTELKEELFTLLEESEDPRVIGGGEEFDEYPYRAGYRLR
ncbi:MAG: sulfatase [Bacteroidota bacterium]|nr:sulfatase [Bacteroidota bacterium]